MKVYQQVKWWFGGMLLLLLPACATTGKNSAGHFPYKRILVLGNSITIHYGRPSIGWHHSWGMAASDSSKDYVHLLRQKIAAAGSPAKLNILNIAAWENNFGSYSYHLLDNALAFQPDLVVVRVGENVKVTRPAYASFASSFDSLLTYIRKASPDCTIACGGSFWNKPAVDSILNSVVVQYPHASFFRLGHLSADSANMAYGQFEHKGVAMHPSDAGMQKIADQVWEAMIKK